ncbi:EAL domain-containing protein [Enterobacter pasteurii]|uniref:EAL domain-containing protein n=1 Tax=Enterobacter pasteurii TaxID=3029761 RepID=UPI0011DCD174|nr:EAL domain-containing protein [Enterobacter pasteurii]QLA68097.1 EAL domain-containing protein [Enterobacter pasteurii]
MVHLHQPPKIIQTFFDRLRGSQPGKDIHPNYSNTELNYWVQPIICADTSRTVGLEAQLLFRDNHGQLLSFLPANENPKVSLNMIIRLLDGISTCFMPVAGNLPTDFFITIKICALQLAHPKLKEATAKFRQNLQNRAVLVFEIIEHTPGDISDDVLTCIDTLMDHGVQFALGHLGCGNISLKYLENMGFGMLKLARDLTLTCHGTLVYRKTIAAMVGLARSLNIRIAAEGVHTQEQAALLTESGIDFLQGFFYTWPQPAQQFISAYLI